MLGLFRYQSKLALRRTISQDKRNDARLTNNLWDPTRCSLCLIGLFYFFLKKKKSVAKIGHTANCYSKIKICQKETTFKHI